jgi:serine/threonine-protein kinase
MRARNPLKRIGRFHLLEKLGEGAMGGVYLARDPLRDQPVALKVLSRQPRPGQPADFEARFLNEARQAKRLQHPNIVTVYDSGETDDALYLAMEHLAGKTLRAHLDQYITLPVAEVLRIALQISAALAYAHRQGVIHRDIKPANIMLCAPDQAVKLTDFGIVLQQDLAAIDIGHFIGTPRYMSPEQAQGCQVDARTDLFSLSAVLYEMLTGTPLFNATKLTELLFAITHSPPPRLKRTRPDLPESLSSLIQTCLKKSPQARLASADVLYSALLACQQAVDSTSPP